MITNPKVLSAILARSEELIINGGRSADDAVPVGALTGHPSQYKLVPVAPTPEMIASSPKLDESVPGYIYLAAPYSTGLIETSPTLRHAAMLRRRRRIDTAAAELISQGHVVYSPISHGCAIEPHISTTMTHDDWLKQCRPLLLAARELRVLMLPGWSESRGVAQEILWATAAGIPVSYMEGRL